MTQLTAQSWVNGESGDLISVYDRGLQYGDGFFTSILAVGNSLLNWSGHWRRIQRAARQLQFVELDESLLPQQLANALQSHSFNQNETLDQPIQTLVVKVIVTRGVAGRGYPIPSPSDVKPTVLIQIGSAPIALYAKVQDGELNICFPTPEAMAITRCSTQAGIQPSLAGIKHLNRLENVLARSEVAALGQDEGLMLNAFGYVVCGTQSNLLMIKDQQLITPKLEQSGVEGTTRYQLSQLARDLGFTWQEADITLAELQQADELFLANAVRGIMPIKALDGQSYSTTQALSIHQAWCAWQAVNVLCLDAFANNKVVEDQQ